MIKFCLEIVWKFNVARGSDYRQFTNHVVDQFNLVGDLIKNNNIQFMNLNGVIDSSNYQHVDNKNPISIKLPASSELAAIIQKKKDKKNRKKN